MPFYSRPSRLTIWQPPGALRFSHPCVEKLIKKFVFERKMLTLEEAAFNPVPYATIAMAGVVVSRPCLPSSTY